MAIGRALVAQEQPQPSTPCSLCDPSVAAHPAGNLKLANHETHIAFALPLT